MGAPRCPALASPSPTVRTQSCGPSSRCGALSGETSPPARGRCPPLPHCWPHPPHLAISQVPSSHWACEEMAELVWVTGGGLQKSPLYPQVGQARHPASTSPRHPAQPCFSDSPGWRCSVTCSEHTHPTPPPAPAIAAGLGLHTPARVSKSRVGAGTRPCRAPALELAGHLPCPGVPTQAPSPSLPPSGGRSINVTGQGFSLIQKFAMVVIAEPLQSWRRRREAGPLQPVTVSRCPLLGRHARAGCSLCQVA